MHSAIAQFPSTQFYNGELENGINDEERSLPNLQMFLRGLNLKTVQQAEVKSGESHVIFLDINAPEERYNNSTRNAGSAQLTVNVVSLLLKHEVVKHSKEIGVITFYSAQRKLLDARFQNVSTQASHKKRKEKHTYCMNHTLCQSHVNSPPLPSPRPISTSNAKRWMGSRYVFVV